ncbi:hypothetical protein ORI98_06190 [Shewanella sp. ULN5]|uniref:hypothetical protein n=1 Tax=Shewanella sp. ULN5 TaxID=2994678 RepID=UPI00273CFF7E|nr:hypothetical protein [Shewanella sp. ULN5]MDP5146024.1 hypothetical protein [Shewanella sp. ULN5]
MKNAAFKHLLAHFRGTKEIVKSTLQINLTCTLAAQQRANDFALAKHVGALECLYWQAMGNGLTNLGKGIRRYTQKLKSHVKVDGL